MNRQHEWGSNPDGEAFRAPRGPQPGGDAGEGHCAPAIEPPEPALSESVYEHLRAIAGLMLKGERRNHTLSATALVHEAYLRILNVGSDADPESARFLFAASQAMRRILIDHARRKGAAKRGGGWNRSIESVEQLSEQADETEVVALDGAFVRLEAEDPRAAAVVRLRFYAGLSVEKTAEVLGLSRRSVLRDWEYARAFLLDALREQG